MQKASSRLKHRIFRAIGAEFNERLSRKDIGSVDEFVGFQPDGAVVLPDRRGTLKAEIPNRSGRAETLDDDPLAI